MSARSLILIIVLCSAGCQASRSDAEAPATPSHRGASPAAVALSPSAQLVYERTLTRDAALPCEELTAGLSDPVPPMLEVVEEAPSPPRSGMQAATCLIQHHAPSIETQMIRWVSERETMGLGLLVLNHLGGLEPALARRLADAALAGEFAERARPRIERELGEPGPR